MLNLIEKWRKMKGDGEDELCTQSIIYSVVKGPLNRAVQCRHCNGNNINNISYNNRR